MGLIDAVKKSLKGSEYTVTTIMMPKMRQRMTGQVTCDPVREATEPGFLIATVDGKFQARVFASAVDRAVWHQWRPNWKGNAPRFTGPPKLKASEPC